MRGEVLMCTDNTAVMGTQGRPARSHIQCLDGDKENICAQIFVASSGALFTLDPPLRECCGCE